MYNDGQWSESRFNSFIKGIIRSGTQRWPPKFAVLNAAKRGKFRNVKTGRMAEHYECAKCQELFPAKEVQVDHKIAVIPETGFTTWDDVIERMFCDSDGLQVLCKTCHSIKTKEENRARRETKKNKSMLEGHEAKVQQSKQSQMENTRSKGN